MTETPNHALQRTAAGRHSYYRRVSWPPSLSSGRQAFLMRVMKLITAIFSLLAAPLFLHAFVMPGLPSEAAKALHTSTNVVLYSLEPREHPKKKSLHNFKILGETKLDGKEARTAITAFETAMVQGADPGVTFCFNPRHALRVEANGHTYDFVLCYECHWLSVMRDDKNIAALNAVGTPDQLNKLLSAHKIRLAKSE